jgi:hypothetical protein
MALVTRDELYECVWSKPMVQVAEQFGVSGSYMTRVCSALRVPRPGAGYWAKVAVGRAPPPKPLPQAQPGDQLYWSKGGDLDRVPAIKPEAPAATRSRKRIAGTHALVRDAKTHFESGRKVKEGQYLKPYKKLLLDVTASQAGLDKALDFANDLYNVLESAGHRVVLAPSHEQLRRGELDEHEAPKKKQLNYDHGRLWSPWRPTVVYVGTVAIGLAVIEMSESVQLRYVKGKYIRDADYAPPKISHLYGDHTWTTTEDLPCGRLRLVAYSPYWTVSWSQRWQETNKASLKRELPAILKALEAGAVELVAKLEEAERQAEIRRQERLAEQERRRQEEDRRQVEESIKESREQLAGLIQDWGEVMNVERFFQGVQAEVERLPANEQARVLERLRLAREFMGTQDPMEVFCGWKTPVERYQPTAIRPKRVALE